MKVVVNNYSYDLASNCMLHCSVANSEFLLYPVSDNILEQIELSQVIDLYPHNQLLEMVLPDQTTQFH